jgi:caffeoyl-CoA O-methyltransferase
MVLNLCDLCGLRARTKIKVSPGEHKGHKAIVESLAHCQPAFHAIVWRGEQREKKHENHVIPEKESLDMSVMVENPHVYFSQWIADRPKLLREMESEAADQGIPIVGPVVGRLLYLLARLSNANRILELGTATGYSAIHMGEAIRARAGRITSLEIESGMAKRARQNITRAGLDAIIEVRREDAMRALKTFDRRVDMVFMDVEKQDYVKLLPALTKIVKSNGLLVADNTGFKDADRFNQAIHENTKWDSVNLWAFLPSHSPTQDGLCIAVRQ